MILVVSFEIISCLLDMNRWQPWEYLYLTLVVISIVFYKNNRRRYTAVAFVLWSTYFFSGLSKFNSGFLTSIWEKMILIQFLHLPSAFAHSRLLHLTGFVIPLIEIMGAMLLLFASTQKKGAAILIATHVFNLIFLGPLGINYNKVVWPWNAVMIVLLAAIYIKNDVKINWKIMLHKHLLWLLILWGVLPLTHLFGLWDTYLSSSLYSGKTKHLNICVDTLVNSYPQALQPFINKTSSKIYCASGVQISATKWSMTELNVPCYPEERVYKKLAENLRKQYPNASFHFVVYTSKRRIAEY